MASNRMEQVEVQRQQIRESPHPERPTIVIPETRGKEVPVQDSPGPKPWDLEVIRNERAARCKVQFSEASYTSSRRHRQSLGSRTDCGTDIRDGPVANPFLNPTDGIAPDDCSVLSSPSKLDSCHDIATFAPNGTFAVARSPEPERKTWRGLGSRTDCGTDIRDGPVANPFLNPTDGIAPDDCSVLSSPSKLDSCHDIATFAPNGTFAVARSPEPERKTWRGRRRKSETRHQGPHPFVPGKVRRKTPGEVNHRHYTQYVYSKADTDYTTTHHYLCETTDLNKPVYYYMMRVGIPDWILITGSRCI